MAEKRRKDMRRNIANRPWEKSRESCDGSPVPPFNMTNPERIERAVELNRMALEELMVLKEQPVPSLVRIQRVLDYARQVDAVLQALECSIRTGHEPEMTR